MDLAEAIEQRHSVRSYTEQRIEGEVLAELQKEVAACNEESGLNIQLIVDEPEAFSGFKAHYGKFSNVRNYLGLIGKKEDGLDEKIGYYGERLVLKAQQLGLNTCWVALTYSKRKSKCVVEKGEKMVCVIALGYGATQGVAHKSKPVSSLCRTDGDMPAWFAAGMNAAILAPTAINQQKFRLTLEDNKVHAESMGGPYASVDLGIVKHHFEIGAGLDNFEWA